MATVERSFFMILCNDVRERPGSLERHRENFFGLLQTESLTTFTSSGHIAVNLRTDLGFYAFLLRLFIESVTWNQCIQRWIWLLLKVNFQWNFACTVLNDFVSKYEVAQNIFPLWFKTLWSKIKLCNTIFKYETKKDTTLLLVELLSVTWILCILRHTIFYSLQGRHSRSNWKSSVKIEDENVSSSLRDDSEYSSCFRL